ncbi:uncharacterized protein I303_105333 [Kwoniella dejecticola CBS 10117]|uniref:RNase III domain-containing protein n=1 Tax=Kwoniella dejecticola CBS 10117 TaxID=1296121 RepID=A0A1A6A2S5_9TREE|nr:uncharacterized protein I303_05220 [Kwoniella dejecticola CBS 10117]OBR84362.1 hypothetical protein I303_05220 [Kwoniella dejecticola CBS 10117]
MRCRTKHIDDKAAELDKYILPPVPQIKLPSLPAITDHTLANMISSHVHRPVTIQAYDSEVFVLETGGNNKFEDLHRIGEALYAGIAADYLQDTYPSYGHGIASTRSSHPAYEFTPKDIWICQTSVLTAYIGVVYLSRIRSVVSPCTRGQAVQYLSEYLQPIIEALADFVIHHLRIEEKRIQAIYPVNIVTAYTVPEGWMVEDEEAKMGKKLLHAHGKIGSIPTYNYEQVEGPWMNPPWIATCKVVDHDGNIWEEKATRLTKQLAGNVAAWKVLEAMGGGEKEN